MAATAADDLAGNASLVATQFSIAYDNTGPTPVITSTASPGPTNGATIPISIDFGETVTDFVDGELMVVTGRRVRLWMWIRGLYGPGDADGRRDGDGGHRGRGGDRSLEQPLERGDAVYDCFGSDGAGALDHFFGRGSDRDESDSDFGGLWGDGHRLCRRRPDGRQRDGGDVRRTWDRGSIRSR